MSGISKSEAVRRYRLGISATQRELRELNLSQDDLATFAREAQLSVADVQTFLKTHGNPKKVIYGAIRQELQNWKEGHLSQSLDEPTPQPEQFDDSFDEETESIDQPDEKPAVRPLLDEWPDDDLLLAGNQAMMAPPIGESSDDTTSTPDTIVGASSSSTAPLEELAPSAESIGDSDVTAEVIQRAGQMADSEVRSASQEETVPAPVRPEPYDQQQAIDDLIGQADPEELIEDIRETLQALAATSQSGREQVARFVQSLTQPSEAELRGGMSVSDLGRGPMEVQPKQAHVLEKTIELPTQPDPASEADAQTSKRDAAVEAMIQSIEMYRRGIVGSVLLRAESDGSLKIVLETD